MISIRKSVEFAEWFSQLQIVQQKQIDARLWRIQELGHFGDAKYIGDGLAELRWKNGLRVYFYKQNAKTIVLILGGLKNGQVKDIKKAKILFRKYALDKDG